MDAYQPTARRPIADLFRRTADGAVRFCVRRGVSPDTVSYSSVVAAAAAALCFWQAGRWIALVIPAVFFCYVRLWLNMLDGMVALAANKASLRGELLNDLPDRISDALIFGGIAESGLCFPATGYWAAIFALLTAYVGTFGQALGVGRQFGGVMAKPWRMVALHVGSWIALGLHWTGKSIELGSLTALDWTNLVVIFGCAQSMVVRLRQIMRRLAEREPVRK
ncbi:MAG TPA: CDP-alcohol phosphatidyltransferase family protein [Pirellulales bacterium]|nr:CDP-alcohol phosphatidyltransferase family protein [Pirellulales bacterium]